jgi:hypothetical protein
MLAAVVGQLTVDKAAAGLKIRAHFRLQGVGQQLVA